MKISGYKIIIAVLLAIIVLQWLFILEKHKRPPVPSYHIKGKIAIIIDDWGYSLHNLPVASQIKQPFTAAILPNLPYSLRVAEALQEQGKEVALHLPLEPREKYGLEKNTIFTASTERLPILQPGFLIS